MTAANYDNCYKLTRIYEGGNDDDPRDPGGRTSRGIIQREYDKYRDEKDKPHGDVWKASEDEIADIYRTKYWQAVVGDQWPDGCDLVVWDCGVNSGPARAKQFAEALLGKSTIWGVLAATCRATTDKTVFVKDFCAKRLAFLEGLRTFSTFGKGWSRRVASVEANGVRMALAAAGTPQAEIKKKLETEAGQAKTSASTHGKVATGSGGGTVVTGGHATTQNTTDVHGFDWNAVGEVLVAVGLAVLAIYCIHWMLVHRQRSQAYAEVAAATPA